MGDLSSLRVRLADLTRLRAEYEAVGKRHLVGYLDHMIADIEAEIALLDCPPTDPQPPPNAAYAVRQGPDAIP